MKKAKVNLWCLDIPKSSTLYQDLHLPLGPFAWTLIWADFQEARTFCQSTTVVRKARGLPVSFRLPSWSLVVWKSNIHSLIYPSPVSISAMVGPEPIPRTWGACWEHTLGGTLVHRKGPCAHTRMWRKTQQLINYELKKFYVSRAELCAFCQSEGLLRGTELSPCGKDESGNGVGSLTDIAGIFPQSNK